jgi:hypothetical protein
MNDLLLYYAFQVMKETRFLGENKKKAAGTGEWSALGC